MKRLLGALSAALCACAAIASAAPVTASAASATASAAPAAGYNFYAGAGITDTTPPLAGTAAGNGANAEFAPAFATCPSALFPSRGRFALQEPVAKGEPDVFCDANFNGRWDGIYTDNGFGPASGVHDPLDARAIAISDGRHRPVVFASVDVIGLFDYYTEQARYDLLHRYGVRADLVISADHNESSPDTIGLYGAPQTPAGVGARSGIDEYYLSFLADRTARAAAAAVHALQPARLYANQVEGPIAAGASGNRYRLLNGMSQRISDQFPTSVALPHDDRIAAVDTKMGVLQARTAAGGEPIFTVMSLAAHNQEMGNSGAGLSADWPGAFERAFDAAHRGIAVFLVADNGSEEDPQTRPAVIPNGSENHTSQIMQWLQASATGARLADIAAGAAASAVRLAPGPVTLVREQFCIPLENNGFVALAAIGEFGRRQGYVCNRAGEPMAPLPNGSVFPTISPQFRTFVSVARIGPDLQMIDNPGEAFPALMLGSPFGVQDESCNRSNPAVPTWHANAPFRFQVGLADDMIGYLTPAWAFASGTPGLFNNDICYEDKHGHGHKLESESAGPTSANDVADRLAALLARTPDPRAHFPSGRFVLPDGSYSRWPTGAVGVLIPSASTSSLDPHGGLLIGDPSARAFGARRVAVHGLFMDYDGQPQGAPDITTRGILVLDARGCVAARYYLNVFPSLDTSRPLGHVQIGEHVLPRHACPVLFAQGVPELTPGAAASAGLPADSHAR